MSQHILPITNDTLPSTSVASLLPCRIHHDGRIEQAGAYWKPRTYKGTSIDRGTQHCEPKATPTSASSSKEAFFRGRKLKGTEVALPDHYEGLVLQRVATISAPAKGTDMTATELEDEGEKSTVEETLRVLSRFEEVVVWAQDCSGDDTSDTYTRSLDEWLRTASKVSMTEPIRNDHDSF